MSEHLRKITIRNCGFSASDIKDSLLITAPKLDKDGKPVNNADGTPAMTASMQGSKALLKIVGKTTEAKPGQTDKGEYLKLLGQFQALNLQTGEVFVSGACILPNFITESMGAALRESTSVEFGLEIGVTADADSVTGYVYTVRSLMDAAPSDAMTRLLKAAGMESNVKQIGDGSAGAVTGTDDAKPAANAKGRAK